MHSVHYFPPSSVGDVDLPIFQNTETTEGPSHCVDVIMHAMASAECDLFASLLEVKRAKQACRRAWVL